ncbi:kinase-like domain-containing protein [Absidia repens]|uniref:Kinase-like domain-containing protein n=1 Tax=Absidia repens TaxID=90262 RepID=A0A1X2ISY0_9FUNG|nr:kinase-like domain-containing protein [Absidia repens]
MTKSTDSLLDTADFVQHRFDVPASAIRRHVSLNARLRQSIPYSKNQDPLNKAPLLTPVNKNNSISSMNSQSTNGIEDYKLGGIIGYGSSAAVYSALYIPRNVRVAIKMIDLDMFERNQIDELRRETALMALSKHENILPVYKSFVSGSKLCIVTPYLAGGSCLDIMKTAFPDGLDELSIATILKQALEGLRYLHKNGHIHRDVKAGNLLVNDDGSVLLGDFGVSSSLSERGVRRTFVGTPCWMAPEVMEQAGYDYKADIWSFGITAIELASGKAPLGKLPPLKVLLMTLSNDPPTLIRETTKHKYSKVFKDMIDFCLNKEPSNRPTVEKLLSHPFFKQARKKEYLVKNILMDLPALERRPRKAIHRRQLSFTTVEEWDFNDDCDYQRKFNVDANTLVSSKNSDTTNKAVNNNINQSPTAFTMNPPSIVQHVNLSPNEIALPTKQEPRISFDRSVRVDDNYDSKTFIEHTSSRLSSGIKCTKYGGDTDCQNNTNNNSLKDTSEPTSPVPPSIPNDLYPTYPLTKSASSGTTGERKSRFKIQYYQDPIMVSLPSIHNSLLLPTATTSLSNGNTVSSNNSYSTSTSEDSATKMITRTRSASSTSISSSTSKFPLPSQQHCNYLPGEKDVDDYEGHDSRKVGRFELLSTATLANDVMIPGSSSSRRTSLEHQLSATPLPSSPSSSSLPLLHNTDNAMVSFSTTSETDLRRQGTHSNDGHRLSNSSVVPSPTASVPGTTFPFSIYPHLQSHFEDLLRNNDAQQRTINMIFESLHFPRPKTGDHSQFHGNYITSQNDGTLFLIESLEKQLHQLEIENSTLKLENEQLRKELDSL